MYVLTSFFIIISQQAIIDEKDSHQKMEDARGKAQKAKDARSKKEHEDEEKKQRLRHKGDWMQIC